MLIDLLAPSEEELYSSNPSHLRARVLALSHETKHIIIDEIQKIPKLLDVVHQLIEGTDKVFIMTGSSARKLRHRGANLLAGRAFVYNLYPFTALEIGEDFDLDSALKWGTLPSIIYDTKTEEEKVRFLQSYAQPILRKRYG